MRAKDSFPVAAGEAGPARRAPARVTAISSATALLAGLLPLAAPAADAPALAPAHANATINVNGTVLPNLNGIWTRRGSFLFQADTRDPLKETPPYKPDWMKEYDDYRHKVAATGEITLDPTSACLPPGVPRMMNAVYPMEILMTPGQVTIIEEWMGETRRIYTDGRKHQDDPDVTYVGDSIGHWEKDGTLVIDTIALEPDTILDQSGLKHSAQLHFIERMKLISPNVMQNQMTLDDPVAFVHPWTVTRTFDRAKPGESIHEFVCEQNNRNPVSADGTEGVVLQNGKDKTTVMSGSGPAQKQQQPQQKPQQQQPGQPLRF